MSESVQNPTRVVILGGGFAGVYTAKYLTKLLGRRRDVEVELLSEENYFVFQPLLPEVAAGGIAATHVVNPIRELVPKARFRCCSVASIDFESKQVMVSQGAGVELVSVPYDQLVFCLGKVTHFANMPGVAEHALAMKDLADAFRLRNHVLRCLELHDDDRRRTERFVWNLAGLGSCVGAGDHRDRILAARIDVNERDTGRRVDAPQVFQIDALIS